TFADTKAIVPYLAELGISDLYASPILKARRGSTHGYDIVDATALNPELGSEDDFSALHEEMRRHDIGLLLDIVPNHMAASHENAWWVSVLENGRDSRFVHFFDIDWRQDKILLPLLGKPYGEALESGEIRLGYDAEGFYLTYYDHRIPLAPDSYALVLRCCDLPEELRELIAAEEVTNSRFLKDTLWRVYEQNARFRETLDGAVREMTTDQLDALLEAQKYRLAYWRMASETINCRRFFDVSDLTGVRVENPEVCEARNRKTLDLIAEGKVTGLRIDQIERLSIPRLEHLGVLHAHADE